MVGRDGIEEKTGFSDPGDWIHHHDRNAKDHGHYKACDEPHVVIERKPAYNPVRVIKFQKSVVGLRVIPELIEAKSDPFFVTCRSRRELKDSPSLWKTTPLGLPLFSAIQQKAGTQHFGVVSKKIRPMNQPVDSTGSHGVFHRLSPIILAELFRRVLEDSRCSSSKQDAQPK